MKIARVLFVALLLMAVASATTYYVAKTGNDLDPGSEGAPWLTIEQAAVTATAGDTVWVKAGTYDEDVDFNDNAGTEADPIVFKSYDGWNTTIDGYVRFYEMHVVLDSFRLLYGPVSFSDHTVKFYTDSCTIKNCEVVMIPANGAGAIGITFEGGAFSHTGVVIDNNTVHGFGITGNEHGIYVTGKNHTITRNVVYGNRGYGIHMYQGSPYVDSCEVAYNILYGSIANGGILVLGFGNWIHDNLIYDNPLGAALHIYDERCYDNEFSNNVLIDNGRGMWITSSGNNVFRNNVCVRNLGEVWIDADSVGAAVLDYNCYGTGSSFHLPDGRNYNFADYQDSTEQEDNSMLADPLFVDSASHNFHLTASSPCIDAGDPTTLPGFDIEGATTPQGAEIDIGAYEYEDGRGPAKRHWKKPRKNKVVGP